MSSPLPPQLTTPPPDYFVLLDLEATTDDPTDPSRPEIIEFPWVTLSTPQLTPLDHKQIYITPRHNHNPNPPPDFLAPSPDVLFSQSLSHALSLFHAYIYHSFLLPQRPFLLVFDGHWDLTHLLYPEAVRKGISLAAYFGKFINLRAEFHRCFPQAAARDRKGMCQYLSIPHPARASGIQECSTLAHILTHILSNPQHTLSPISLPPPPPLAQSLATAVPVGGIVRLRGLPWMAGVEEVETFLERIPIVPGGVHFVNNAQGRSTGEAFVQIATLAGVEDALRRHRGCVGKRYIEVFKSSPGDMATFLGRVDARRQVRDGNALKKNSKRNGRRLDLSQQVQSAGGKGPVVRVSNLPDDADVDDVLRLFNDLDVSSERVTMHQDDTKCSREAYVQLLNDANLVKALSKSGSAVTTPSAVTTVVDVRKNASVQLPVRNDSPEGRKRTRPDTRFFLRVNNILDETVDVSTLSKHFSRFHITEDDVKISKPRPPQRMARISFRTRQQRDDALSIDCRALGATVILEDGGMDTPKKQTTSSPRVVRMRGLPYTSNEDDIVDFFDGYTIAPGGITRGKDRHGRASGEAWVRFVNAEDAREVVSKLDKAHMGNRYIELKF